MHFPKKSGRLSSTGSEILTFGSHCSANFQPILDCFIPKFKLEYDDLENIKADCVNAVVFNLYQIKRLKFFGTPGSQRLQKVFRLSVTTTSSQNQLPSIIKLKNAILSSNKKWSMERGYSLLLVFDVSLK